MDFEDPSTVGGISIPFVGLRFYVDPTLSRTPVY